MKRNWQHDRSSKQLAVTLYTPLAKADIWSCIAEKNQIAANRVEQAIYQRLRLSCRRPSTWSSTARSHTRPVRFWTLTRYPNYSPFTGPNPLQIVAVLHGKRTAAASPRRLPSKNTTKAGVRTTTIWRVKATK